MNIVASKKEKKFTVIDNGFAQDRRLSLAARGLLTIILTLKNIGGLSLEDVAYYAGGGSIDTRLRKVRALCVELEQYGYCVVSKGKDSKGRFASNYDFYEVPNQPPPIAVRSNVATFNKPSRNTEAATENPTAATADGKPQTENRSGKPFVDNGSGLYIDSSIKRKDKNKDKNKEENKDKNPLSHTRAREDFEIENIAVAANEKSQTSTPPAPPPPDQSRLTLWKDSGFAPNSEGGKEKFIKEVKGYMWNYHYLHKDLTEDNFDFDAFYLKCDTVFSNERATEGLAKRHRSDDFAKKAVVMLMTVKDSKYQHKDFLKDSNKQTDNNGNNNREGDTRSRIFKSLGIKEI